jgi:hypothetical protein
MGLLTIYRDTALLCVRVFHWLCPAMPLFAIGSRDPTSFVSAASSLVEQAQIRADAMDGRIGRTREG